MQITIVACDNKPPKIFCSDTCMIAGEFLSLDILVTDETSSQVTLTATGAPYLGNAPLPIPVNVTGAPPLQTHFDWQTVCEHVKKTPYQLFLKATDNGPQVNLTSFNTVNIRVIAPPLENLISTPIKNSIALEWDTYNCSNAKEVHIYKKSSASNFEPDWCETGIPTSTGFQFLTKINSSNTYYLDDGAIRPVLHGREYCYRIIAVFDDGTESIASNETCAAIANDAPMITNVDITKTSENEGAIFVAWLPPPEIDKAIFPGPKYEYRIFRSSKNKNTFEHVNTFYSLYDTSFFDHLLNTKETQYYYQIEFWGENKSGIMESIETSDPASSIFLSIYETDKKLQLTWNEEVSWENYAYILYRFNENTQQFDSLTIVLNNNYEDCELTNGVSYCYYIQSEGRHLLPDTVAPLLNRSQEICGEPYDNIPPDTPNADIETDCKNVTFLWTFPHIDSYLDAYQYYIHYQPHYKTEMFCIDSFPNFDVCFPSPCSHIIENLPSITGCYSMLIKDEAGNLSEMTPKLCFDVDECDTYRLPNVFTPDGDGINDTWIPFPYSNVEKINLEVYDRWGKRVFKTEDPDIKWDGFNEHSHRPCPEGTYYYGCDVFLFTLDGIKMKMLTGTVVILRNSKAAPKY
jgi:gliding motility-associated-like protein